MAFASFDTPASVMNEMLDDTIIGEVRLQDGELFYKESDNGHVLISIHSISGKYYEQVVLGENLASLIQWLQEPRTAEGVYLHIEQLKENQVQASEA